MKKGKLSKAASLFLSLMLVLTMIPSLGTDTAWAEDDASGTETTPKISFRICDATESVNLGNTFRNLEPGESLTRNCEVEKTTPDGDYMASFAADRKTLLLNNYDSGSIIVYYTNELTLELKGENTIRQFINRNYNTALGDKLLTGISVDGNNQLNLTITSANQTSKGKLILKNDEVFGVDTKHNELYGITAKSLTLDNVELEVNLKNDENRTSCTALSTHEDMKVGYSSIVNINIFDFGTENQATVKGLCSLSGTLKIEQSTVNVNFKNCTTSGWGDLYGIAKFGGGTDENKRDILISNSNVSIKAENAKLAEDYPESKYGIYCYDSKGKIKISENSSVTIDGGDNKFGYGILDRAVIEDKEAANCAGVIVDGNNTLNISNVIYGISSYKRGVDMIGANVNVNADDTAVYGYNHGVNSKNLGEYGLHVTGSSQVDLKACKNAVKVNADGVLQFAKGRIDLSEGGYLKMSITRNADDTIDSPTQDVGIITAEEVLHDAFGLGSNTAITCGAIRVHPEDKSNEFYTAQSAAPTTLDNGQKKYELEFKYHNRDILKVKWNQSTNEVSWSDSSLMTKYRLDLEGAEKNGSTEPEYKVLTKIVGPYEGKSYTLPKNITDMMIPTMNYRIKVTPYTTNTDWKTIDSMASYSNVKSATEEVGSLDLTKIGYWQIGWSAIEKAQAYHYEIKKYNEETNDYKTVFEMTGYKSDDRKQEVYDLRDDLMRGKAWCKPGKYILSVTAIAGGNEDNVLARGETTEPITAAGDDNYAVATKVVKVKIAKRLITVKANDKTMTVNGTLPTFDVTYGNFAAADTKDTVIETEAVAGVAAEVDGKTVGSFDITITTAPILKTGMADKYDFAELQKGVLKVNAASAGGGAIGGGGFIIPTTQKPEVTIDNTQGKLELSADGTTANITANEGYEIEKVTVNGVDKGAVNKLTGLKTGDKVVVSFKSTAPAADDKDAVVKQLTSKISKLQIVARSVKTSKKNVKVTLKTDAQSNAAIKEIKSLGYTVKYKFYRSTKKSKGYKAVLTKTSKTYTNTKGVKGTMYYYKARIQVFDKDGKLVAQTALKQCKYANRQWTK